MPKKVTSENQVKHAILSYLSYISDCFVFPVASVGIYDAKKRIYRKPTSRFHINGVADILGLYRGKFIAIECKAGKNKASPEQINFLKKVKEQGGIAILAYSLEDVIDALTLESCLVHLA